MLLWCKIVKKGGCSTPLWSFNFLPKLMGAANCVRFCLNPFCPEVHEGCLHQLGLEVERAEHYILLFFSILYDIRNIFSF